MHLRLLPTRSVSGCLLTEATKGSLTQHACRCALSSVHAESGRPKE
jgi:hypothetical protein